MSSRTKFPWALLRNFKLSRRDVAQNPHGCKDRNNKITMFTLRKAAFELSGYNKYGLYTHDVINYANPIVREALRRLPEDIVDARNFRIIRAAQLNFLKIFLPKEKWVTFEQDLEYRYLDPYMKEIEAERAEIDEFGCLNYSDTDWPANKPI